MTRPLPDSAYATPGVSHRATAARESAAGGSIPSLATRHLADSLFLACGLAWGAGLIHVQAAFGHAQESALHTVFFAVLACAQLSWGVAIYRGPSRRLLAVGAAVGLMVVGVWVASRTIGVPIGPGAWTPEPVGLSDSLASADEIVVALIVIFQLRPRGARLHSPGLSHAVAAAGVFLVLLSSLVATLGGSGH